MKFKQLLTSSSISLSLLLVGGTISPTMAIPPIEETDLEEYIVEESAEIGLEGTQSSTEFRQSAMEDVTVDSLKTTTDNIDLHLPSLNEENSKLEEVLPNTGIDGTPDSSASEEGNVAPVDSVIERAEPSSIIPVVNNCQNISQQSILISGSTAILVSPLSNITFSADTSKQTELFKLAGPLSLAEGCELPVGTLVEAQIETTENKEGLTINMKSIIVSGYYFPLSAQSNVISFKKRPVDKDQREIQNTTDDALCDASGILTSLLLNSMDMTRDITSDISLELVSNATASVCKGFSSETPSYFLEADLKTEAFYNLHLGNIQSIEVPEALRRRP